MSSVGYLLVIGHSLILEKMVQYSAALPTIYDTFKGKYLALGGPGRGVECLHGSWTDRSLVLAEFSSVDSVKSFWHSKEYGEAKELRKGAGIFDVFTFSGEKVQQDLQIAVFVIHLHRVNHELCPSQDRPLFKMPEAILLASVNSSSYNILEGDLDSYEIDVFGFTSHEAAVAGVDAFPDLEKGSDVSMVSSSQILLLNAN